MVALFASAADCLVSRLSSNVTAQLAAALNFGYQVSQPRAIIERTSHAAQFSRLFRP